MIRVDPDRVRMYLHLFLSKYLTESGWGMGVMRIVDTLEWGISRARGLAPSVMSQGESHASRSASWNTVRTLDS